MATRITKEKAVAFIRDLVTICEKHNIWLLGGDDLEITGVLLGEPDPGEKDLSYRELLDRFEFFPNELPGSVFIKLTNETWDINLEEE
jgi:hypothetical protein